MMLRSLWYKEKTFEITSKSVDSRLVNACCLSHRADTSVTTDTHAVRKEENKTFEKYNRGKPDHMSTAGTSTSATPGSDESLADQPVHLRGRTRETETLESDAEK